MADLGPVEDRIDSMRTRVALISGLGIGLAGVLASLLSGSALAPLSRLRRSVAGVTHHARPVQPAARRRRSARR